jgi:hypothetical protein
MRSANGGTDQSASTPEKDRRNDARARMLVLVPFGADGSAEAKADEGPYQSMAAIASPPGSSITPPAGIPDLGQNYRDGRTLRNL